jgi:hypothetical protein
MPEPMRTPRAPRFAPKLTHHKAAGARTGWSVPGILETTLDMVTAAPLGRPIRRGAGPEGVETTV